MGTVAYVSLDFVLFFFFGNGLDAHSKTEPKESFIHILQMYQNDKGKRKVMALNDFREETPIYKLFSTLKKNPSCHFVTGSLTVRTQNTKCTNSIY